MIGYIENHWQNGFLVNEDHKTGGIEYEGSFRGTSAVIHEGKGFAQYCGGNGNLQVLKRLLRGYIGKVCRFSGSTGSEDQEV